MRRMWALFTPGSNPVSYTHLDVYKRQAPDQQAITEEATEYFNQMMDGDFETFFNALPQGVQAVSYTHLDVYKRQDPKGGTLDQCGRFLQREKYRVRVCNSIDFSKSMHYNPLAYIKTESDVLKFVTALIANRCV